MIPVDKPLIKMPTEQDLRNAMLSGSVVWWGKYRSWWRFHYAEHKDVYDRIFPINNLGTAFVKIYSRSLDKSERRKIRASETHCFREA